MLSTCSWRSALHLPRFACGGTSGGATGSRTVTVSAPHPRRSPMMITTLGANLPYRGSLSPLSPARRRQLHLAQRRRRRLVERHRCPGGSYWLVARSREHPADSWFSRQPRTPSIWHAARRTVRCTLPASMPLRRIVDAHASYLYLGAITTTTLPILLMWGAGHLRLPDAGIASPLSVLETAARLARERFQCARAPADRLYLTQ